MLQLNYNSNTTELYADSSNAKMDVISVGISPQSPQNAAQLAVAHGTVSPIHIWSPISAQLGIASTQPPVCEPVPPVMVPPPVTVPPPVIVPPPDMVPPPVIVPVPEVPPLPGNMIGCIASVFGCIASVFLSSFFPSFLSSVLPFDHSVY